MQSQLDRLWIRLLSDLENPNLKSRMRKENEQVIIQFTTSQDTDVIIITYSFPKATYQTLKHKWQ